VNKKGDIVSYTTARDIRITVAIIELRAAASLSLIYRGKIIKKILAAKKHKRERLVIGNIKLLYSGDKLRVRTKHKRLVAEIMVVPQ